MSIELTYALGSRVRARGEEWAVEKCQPICTGGHAVHVSGLTELVRGQAIFLDGLDAIQALRTEDTRLVVGVLRMRARQGDAEVTPAVMHAKGGKSPNAQGA